MYRLTEAKETQNSQQTWIQQFNYDRYGNRIAFNQNITGILYGQITQTPQVDPQTNRFTSGDYSYDFNGNIVKDLSGASEIRTFTFNGDNKQTEIKQNNLTIGRYFYDGEGKRVKKVTNLEETVFVYDGLGKLIAEYSTDISQTPQTKYLTEDHLGTPRIITDATGQTTARRDFLPFGEDLFAGVGARNSAQKYGATADDIRQKFTGYQKDNETSLDFAEARMYENRFGRFTAVDPLLASGRSANPQTFNRYVYVQNSPIIATDPTGLCGGPNEPKCERNSYNKPTYTKIVNGKRRWNDGNPDGTWTAYTGEPVVDYPDDCGGCRTIFHSNGWYEQPVRPYNPIRDLINGFPESPFLEAGSGFGTGLKNVPITFLNTVTTTLTISDSIMSGTASVDVDSLSVNFGTNPLYIKPYGCSSSINCNWSTATTGAAFAAPGVVGGVFSGGAASLSVVPEYTIASAPLKIPANAKVVEQVKPAGYLQDKYTWTRGKFKYEARWHTPTKPELASQGNTWVITRTTPGNAQGAQKVQHVLTGKYKWTTMYEWQTAVTANQTGTATAAQRILLSNGHWSSW